MKKAVLILVALVVVAAVAGLALKDRVIKSAVENGIQQLTGLDLAMDRMTASLWHTTVRVEGLRLMNPPGYPDPVAVEVADLFVDYDLFSLFSDEIHLNAVRIIIPELTVIRNDEGEMNFGKIMKTANRRQGGSTPQATPPPGETAPDSGIPGPTVEAKQEQPPAGRESPEKRMRIDDLSVELGQVAYYDYATGGPEPSVFRQNLGLKIHEFDVTSVDQLVGRVTGQLFMGSLGNLHSIAERGQKEIPKLVEDHQEEFKKIQKRAEQRIAEMGDELERMANDPNTSVSDILGALMSGHGAEEK